MKNDETKKEVDIYENMVNVVFDKNEQRLPLWMLMSYDQKLDMLMHERIEEEAEIMQFLIDVEYNLSRNLVSNERALHAVEVAYEA